VNTKGRLKKHIAYRWRNRFIRETGAKPDGFYFIFTLSQKWFELPSSSLHSNIACSLFYNDDFFLKLRDLIFELHSFAQEVPNFFAGGTDFCDTTRITSDSRIFSVNKKHKLKKKYINRQCLMSTIQHWIVYYVFTSGFVELDGNTETYQKHSAAVDETSPLPPLR